MKRYFLMIIVFICSAGILYSSDDISGQEFFKKLRGLARNNNEFNFIKKTFKPGKSNEIKKEVLVKIIPGVWREGESGVILFYKNGSFEYYDTWEEITFIYSGKWKVNKDSVISIKLDKSAEWGECKVKQVDFRDDSKDKYGRYNYFLFFNLDPPSFKVDNGEITFLSNISFEFESRSSVKKKKETPFYYKNK